MELIIRDNLNKSNKYEVYDFIKNESHRVDKSHKLLKEETFKIYFPELYNDICSNDKLSRFSVFKQKLWHYFNDDYDTHVCPICGGELRFVSIKKGYQKHCSDKCRFGDKNYIEKVRTNTKQVWDSMTDRSVICENISKGRKESWNKYTPSERREMTQHLRDGLEIANRNRTEEEWDEINRKRVLSWKTSYYNKTDEEKEQESKRRQESRKEVLKNRTEDDLKRISKNIKDGLNNMSEETKRERDLKRHLAKLRNVQKLRPDVIEIYTPENSKNTIYTCKCTNPDCNKCSIRQYKTTFASYIYRKGHNVETCPIAHPRTIGISIGEKELLEYIKKIYKGEIIANCRNELDGLEIDIFLPELKLGFEFQGDLWHANPLLFDENFVNPINGKSYKEIHEKDEHKMKIAQEKGITLVEIWETDWVENNKKTKRMIKKIIEDGK